MCQEVWEQRLLWWFKFRSGKSFFNVFGSFTWLHYNQTKILENQTLLLARVRFIRIPQAAFWCSFSKNSWRGPFCGSVKSCHWILIPYRITMLCRITILWRMMILYSIIMRYSITTLYRTASTVLECIKTVHTLLQFN